MTNYIGAIKRELDEQKQLEIKMRNSDNMERQQYDESKVTNNW